MKKLYIFSALAVAALGFTACEDDKEPVYSAPTEFVLNTPPMANQTLILQEGDLVNFTCSQPDYGVSLVTNYFLDMTTAEEFVEAEEGTESKPAVESNYYTLTPVTANQANFDVKAEDIAKLLCQSIGIDGFSSYPENGVAPFENVKFRVRANLTGVEGSEIASNVVSLAGIQVYNPFPAIPRFIYFVGAPNGWIEPSAGNADAFADWMLEETGVGTDVYEGSFEIPAGEQYFRFYNALKGWGGDNALPSIGPHGVDGENEMVTITSEPVAHTAVPGKGAWYTSTDWGGGAVTFTVDLSDPSAYKVTMAAGATVKENYVYLCGDFADNAKWVEPSEGNAPYYEDWRLIDRGGTGIYTNTFDIAAHEIYFRIYPALTGWGETPYAGGVNDGDNVGITLGQAYECVTGVGCWTFNWEGGQLTFTLDTNTGKMTVAPASVAE